MPLVLLHGAGHFTGASEHCCELSKGRSGSLRPGLSTCPIPDMDLASATSTFPFRAPSPHILKEEPRQGEEHHSKRVPHVGGGGGGPLPGLS